MSEQQMTRELRIKHLESILGYFRDYNDQRSREVKEALRLSIADLRNEQPCQGRLPGAEFMRKDDGIWLSVKSSKGHYGILNWTALCHHRGPITGDALMQWAEDVLSGHAGEQPCEKCAEWEKAFDELYEVAGKEYKGKIVAAIDRLDPRKPKSETQTEESLADETQTKPCEYPPVGYVLVSQEKMQELWDRCAEWEKAWKALDTHILANGYMKALELVRWHDPRRKQAEEPKPADYDYIFASPEGLNRFLDETNFDAYHKRPREEYFPMLRKPGQAEPSPAETLRLIELYCESRLTKNRPLNPRDWLAGYDYVLRRILGIAKNGYIYKKSDPEPTPPADEPTPEEIEKVKAFVDKVLDGSEPTSLLRDDGEWRM